jgi:hypothetical protein
LDKSIHTGIGVVQVKSILDVKSFISSFKVPRTHKKLLYKKETTLHFIKKSSDTGSGQVRSGQVRSGQV